MWSHHHALEESDPALAQWLDNGPINLGSHVVSDEELAREMVSAFYVLLDYRDTMSQSSNIQVLWKVKAYGDIQNVVDEIIGKEIEEGNVLVGRRAGLDIASIRTLYGPP